MQETVNPPAAESFFNQILMDFQWKFTPSNATNDELAESLTNDDRWITIELLNFYPKSCKWSTTWKGKWKRCKSQLN
jgi:hypothetical protein